VRFPVDLGLGCDGLGAMDRDDSMVLGVFRLALDCFALLALDVALPEALVDLLDLFEVLSFLISSFTLSSQISSSTTGTPCSIG
jgi:hypothetical protein